MEYNIIDKIIVKQILSTMRNDKRITDMLPKTTSMLLDKMLDEDIEQLDGEIMLDAVMKFGRNKDK